MKHAARKGTEPNRTESRRDDANDFLPFCQLSIDCLTVRVREPNALGRLYYENGRRCAQEMRRTMYRTCTHQ